MVKATQIQKKSFGQNGKYLDLDLQGEHPPKMAMKPSGAWN